MRRLGEPQAVLLGDVQEEVEEAVRQADVVVDDEEPVGGIGRMGREQRAQVLPLAQARRARFEVELDGVARAAQLGGQRRGGTARAPGA